MAYVGYSCDVLPLPFNQHESDPGEANSFSYVHNVLGCYVLSS